MISKLIKFFDSIPATLAGGIFMIVSVVLPKININLPINLSWITIIISGTPLIYSAIRN